VTARGPLVRVMAGAGNTFAVVDGERETLPADRAGLARRLCAPAAWSRGLPKLDGVLVVTSDPAAECRMTIYNADGSRPEACGNGLRCVARFAREHGGAASDALRVATDAGVRLVELVRDAGGSIVGARARMGVPHKIERDVVLSTSRGDVTAVLVDMGNPHCVLFVDDERSAPVHELGAELERHARFPQRTNVEFAARREGRWRLRVWERGVGETPACGTGACAAAIAASLEGKAVLPLELELPGGRLTVDREASGEVVLIGPCEDLGPREVALDDPAAARSFP
jgi:diaminopimelate epimerase